MDTGLVTTLIVIGVVVVVLVVIGIWLWVSHKSLVALQGRVDSAWSEIAEQLQQRAELIPTIVSTVQGYASHEKSVFAAVTDARTETLAAGDAVAASSAEGHMQKALKGVFAVAEHYPQLQSSQAFLELQSQLVSTEDKIQSARRHYNGGVRELNTKVKSFPTSTFAKSRGVGPAPFFETAEPAAIAEPPRVQF
ncbi:MULTISPECIES: LemA family protein [unclassified Curtobacterium]|uniref:LemA family protein n=1 Tax=unclassified Curtobacterium TaxID=257496 RepID=UPI000DA70CCF|nr:MULTISPECIES: LemA family protein [unclassified Curtobacterium]PZE64813.1 LemA family protein [Curtobacterium sp. MCBD17_021]WIB27207.1 LemA family protein [Curtobacterium sp. MCSS17_015]